VCCEFKTWSRSMRISSDPARRHGAAVLSACVAVAVVLAGSLTGARAERFECLVEPYLEVNVSSAVPGILEEVRVDRGDRVKKGQVLATLVSDVERAHLDLVRAKVEFAERRVVRNEELYRKQMISIHEKDEMETEARILALELREAEARLAQRTILSPLEGIVVRRFYSPGEFVQEKPIVSLAQVDPLRVEVALPVRLYGKVKVGMTGQVEWEAPLGGELSARVTVVDPVLDAASGTIGIRLELANPERRRPAGTKCLVRFPIPEGN